MVVIVGYGLAVNRLQERPSGLVPISKNNFFAVTDSTSFDAQFGALNNCSLSDTNADAH